MSVSLNQEISVYLGCFVILEIHMQATLCYQLASFNKIIAGLIFHEIYLIIRGLNAGLKAYQYFLISG